ncbi:micrococcal nuclease-like nuclease [Mycobacteroides abscessus subsp. massiliense]|uniref:thermonuclease family protein n=1 Tax=Mycobacteroides abscessus TaxID=36809 RepID=UPI0009A5673C|nr:thermonuclease family protein [Mycobacteroides abscessus]SKN99006.1 micrococcal nuclease-like nuclease [Mycobacteroides abscessus subsp. massiliense]SKO10290.1 micrococcal nuclease-like nuclease [Mycobacteroides abscessus subsp. massiliense]
MAHPITVAIAAISATALIASACTALGRADPVAPNAEIVRVVDGDTLDVRSDTNGRLRIRVLGIDTPEVVKPNAPVECGGPEASDYAKTLFPQGQRVQLVTDNSQDAHDRFGRTLAFVLLPSGLNYSIEAARSGHARAYTYGHRPSRWASEIAAAEHQAQAERAGVWGQPCNGSRQAPAPGA